MLLGHINRAIGKLDVAKMHYLNAKELVESVEQNNDRLISTIIYQQLCIYSSGDNAEPLKNLTSLLKVSSLCINTQVVLRQALGNIYRSAADYSGAKSHFKSAIRLAKSVKYLENKVMECKAELGRAYRSSGCHSKALKRQKKFLDYARLRGDTFNIANACGYIGFTYYSMGEDFYDESVKYLYCKLELCKNELNDLAGYRWCLNNVGKVYLGLKEYDLCVGLFSESGEIARHHGNTLGLGTAYGNLGSAYRAVGKHSEAVKYHKLYLEIAEKNSDTGGVAIMQRELILDHLYLYRDETDKEKSAAFLIDARTYAFRALKTSLEVRSRLSKEDDMLKIGNFEHNQAKIYSLLLFIVIQLGQYEAGLVLSELGRAHALADRIREKFKVNSSFLSDVLGIIGSDNQIIPSALSDVLNKVGKVINGLGSHVLVYSLLDNPLHKGNFKETLLYTWHIQNAPNDQHSMVQVHFNQSTINLAASGTHQLAIDEDYISGLMREVQLTEVQIMDEPKSCLEESKMSRDVVRKKNPAPQSSVPKKDKLEVLYEILINPMSEYIYSYNQHQQQQSVRLIIIPHSFLFGVPFCALKAQGTFLVEKFVICLAPSLYILDIGLQREEEWSKLPSSKEDVRVLAVGNPIMPVNDVPQLPGAEKEVESIKSLLKDAKVLCGKDATKRAVRDSFSEYSVIHLATHAIMEASLHDVFTTADQTRPEPYGVGDYTAKGAIILARSDTNARSDSYGSVRSDSHCSGVLTSSDIEMLNLKPSCELVVLSCCNTGRGKITGDGILGLSRSLMCAGVMNMLVTLWRVYDDTTPLLMEHFYQHYTINRDAPAALQASMLHLIQQNYSIKRWAAFCCIGTRYGFKPIA